MLWVVGWGRGALKSNKDCKYRPKGNQMIKKMIFILALTALAAASNISPALAQHRTAVCTTGTGGSSSVASGASVRKVLVPEGATCTLHNVTVEKDVVVLENARLVVLGSTIGDDLRADEPASIRIDCRQANTEDTACSDFSVVGDDIVVSGTTGEPDPVDGSSFPNYICNGTRVGDDVEITESGPNARWQIGGAPVCTQPVSGNFIGGDLEVEENRATVNIDRNRIVKDLEVEDNEALVTITNNVIGDDLDCDDNNPDPAPGTAGTNQVGDDAKDECASGFTGTPDTTGIPAP